MAPGARWRSFVALVAFAGCILAAGAPRVAAQPGVGAGAPTDPPAAATPSPITATVDRTTLSTDDTVRVSVVVNAASMQLSQLQQPVFDGFAVVGSNSRSQLSMINGAPSFVLGYDYALQPVRSGDLVVPPFSIEIDGQTYRTEPIPLTVTPGSQPTVSPDQLSPGAVAPGERFFISAAVDNDTVWQGEQLVYTFRFYQAANLAQQPSYGAPAFTGFWQRRESDQRSDRVLVGDRLFLLTELDTYLFPTRAGDITIDPARLSLVGDLTVSRDRLATEAITVHVKPLPDGAPPEFDGAVGRYTILASVDRADAAVDDPIRLTVTLAGDGNIETAPDPDWPALDGWQSYDDGQTMAVEAKDGRIVGSRTWKRLLIPTRAGPAALPAIRYAYFDPAAGQYAVAETSPIALVASAANGAPSGAPSAPAAAADDRAAPAASAVTAAPPDTTRWAQTAPLVEPSVPLSAGRRAVDGRAAAAGGVDAILNGAPARWPRSGRLGYWLLWLGPFALIALDHGRLRRGRAVAARRGTYSVRVRTAAAEAVRSLADRLAVRPSGVGPAPVDVAAAVNRVLNAALGPRASGLAHDALRSALMARGVGDELARRTVAALAAGEAAAWRPAEFEAVADASDDGALRRGGPGDGASASAVRTAGADAAALIAALGEALAREGRGR
ncbi:MAG: BatD family protein [Ardenticatenales bacterium]